MSNNNSLNSEEELKRIGGQLGIPVLSPTSAIVVSPDEIPDIGSDQDIDGATDTQGKSRNPMIQYLVSAVMALTLIGIPLSLFFGIGGAQQSASKIPKDKDADNTIPVSDDQVEKLKTQLALDIQTKAATAAEPPTNPPTPLPTPSLEATTPPTPEVKTTPATVVKPVQPIVRTTPQPVVVAPVVQQPIRSVQPVRQRIVQRPIPEAVLQRPAVKVARQIAPKIKSSTPPSKVAPVQRVVPTVTPKTVQSVPTTPPISFQQASALSAYGGLPESSIASTNANALQPAVLVSQRSNLSPTLSLPVGANVSGRTITPFNSISGRNTSQAKQDTLSVVLDQPIELAQGYNLPTGTIVQFIVSVADNGAVNATSKAVFVNGVQINAPVGAFALTTDNSQALIASQRSLRRDELTGSDATAALWGGAGAVGKVLSQAGNQSVISSSGLGATVVQSNNSNPNIFGAVLDGAFSPLAQAQQSRANVLANEIQNLSKLNTIPVQTRIRVFVAVPGVVQIPIAGGSNLQTVEATADPNEEPAVSAPRNMALRTIPPSQLVQPVAPSTVEQVAPIPPLVQPVAPSTVEQVAPIPPLVQPVAPNTVEQVAPIPPLLQPAQIPLIPTPRFAVQPNNQSVMPSTVQQIAPSAVQQVTPLAQPLQFIPDSQGNLPQPQQSIVD
jgi:hypothetical protein